MTSNPGVSVVLSLVASVNATSVMQLLGLSTAGNTTARRRLLFAEAEADSTITSPTCARRRLQATCFPNCTYRDVATANASAASAAVSAAIYAQAANQSAQGLLAACTAAQAADPGALDATGRPVGSDATAAAVDAARNAASAASQAAAAAAAARLAAASGNLTAATLAGNQADLALDRAQNWSAVADYNSAYGLPACQAIIAGTTIPTPDWLYFADYAIEDLPSFVALDVPPLPPNYTSGAGLGLDTGNVIESRLANSSAVRRFTGERGGSLPSAAPRPFIALAMYACHSH